MKNITNLIVRTCFHLTLHFVQEFFENVAMKSSFALNFLFMAANLSPHAYIKFLFHAISCEFNIF